MTATPSLRTLGTRARRAQQRRDEAYAALRDAVIAAVGEGMSESHAAEVAQVDRMTVRKWLGKRP